MKTRHLIPLCPLNGSRRGLPLPLAPLLALILAFGLPAQVPPPNGPGQALPFDAVTHIVSNAGDSGDGSLRTIIAGTATGDRIIFAPGVTGTITLTSGELVIPRTLSIEGPGANVLSISGGNLSRVFRIAAPDVAIAGLRIADGNAPPAFNGGGIRVEALRAAITNCVFANNSAGTSPADGGGIGVMNVNSATLYGCTFSGNQGDNGGAISVSAGTGRLLAIHCTLTGNSARSGSGGGLHALGVVTLVGCTIASNTAPGSGGGIFRNAPGSITIGNCIISGNRAPFFPDINSFVTSGGHNLIGVRAGTPQPTDLTGTAASPFNPLIAPLQDNGGPTPTMALLPGSPALEAGDDELVSSLGLTTDQRGQSRRSRCHVDIGAYERPVALGAPIFVVTANDSGVGSLRAAIACASDGGTILLAPSLSGVIKLTTGELLIEKSLSILGPGPATLAVSGSYPSRVFRVGQGATVTLAGLTIRDGGHYTGATGLPAVAGGILNEGTLLLSNCAVTANTAVGTLGFEGTRATPYGMDGGSASAGAIYNGYVLTLINCTFAQNLARGGQGGFGGGGLPAGGAGGHGGGARGGAIYNHFQLTAVNCTFSGNGAVGGDGGGGSSSPSNSQPGGPGGEAEGGAICNGPDGACHLVHLTITGGLAQGGWGGLHADPNQPPALDGFTGGGGLFDFATNTFLFNTLVAQNTVGNGRLQPGAGPDVFGGVRSEGHNLIGRTNDSSGWVASDLKGSAGAPLDAQLGPLADHGGPTLTHAPASCSPAVDAGDPSVLGLPYRLGTDQRGAARRAGLNPDAGAFETALSARCAAIAVNPTTAPEVFYVAGSTRKISQLIGDTDFERLTPTENRTQTRYNLSGTDLGVSFIHNGLTFVVFGDTGSGGSVFGSRDAIAYTTDLEPEDGLALTFLADGTPWRPITIPGISQGGFEVPLDGVSVNGRMYLYHSTDHSAAVTMGRSVVAASDDNGLNFQLLYTLSRSNFINVSVNKLNLADWPGFPKNSGEGLAIFGSGPYRASNVRLTFQPADAIEDPATLHYFAGLDSTGAPLWSADETEAIALFDQPCVGELSVGWNKFLKRWIMLYNCGSPRGINFRSARQPWGPWTTPQVLFEPWADLGYAHFMHVNWTFRKFDNVQNPGRENEWAGEYGPYLFKELATGSDNRTTIYFTMSTWNPYVPLLMKSELTVNNAPAIAVAPADQVVSPAEAATFQLTASAVGAMNYLWQRDAVNIAGATNNSFTLPAVSVADAGALFRCIVSNGSGSVTSNPVRVVPWATSGAPVPEILLPAPGTFYRGGDTIAFAGRATGAESGGLPAGRAHLSF